MILFKPYIHPIAAGLLAIWAISSDISRSRTVPRDWPLRFFHISLVLMSAISLLSWFKILPLDSRILESISLGLSLGLFSVMIFSKMVETEHRMFKRLASKWPLLMGLLFLTINNFLHFQAVILFYWTLLLIGVLGFYHFPRLKVCFNFYCMNFCLFTLILLLSLKPFGALEYFHILQSLLFVLSLILFTVIYDKIGDYESSEI